MLARSHVIVRHDDDIVLVLTRGGLDATRERVERATGALLSIAPLIAHPDRQGRPLGVSD
jgi:hypothetical protein